jgi:hypothetical protein
VGSRRRDRCFSHDLRAGCLGISPLVRRPPRSGPGIPKQCRLHWPAHLYTASDGGRCRRWMAGRLFGSGCLLRRLHDPYLVFDAR